jgi:mRNA interferase MazF
MARILRGDVIWSELDPARDHEQSGLRPVVVLSQDIFNERSGTAIACALTSQEDHRRIAVRAQFNSTRLHSWRSFNHLIQFFNRNVPELLPEPLH